jgi:cytochrome c-type biogenesis protein CcmH
VLEARVRQVASELRCPVCQGESIQDSPAALAQEMKAIVREQLAAGRTPDEVKAYFVEKYGEWILLRPKARGWNVMVYLLPLLALLGGAVVIARATRRWSTTGTPTPAEPVHEETVDR